MWHSSSFFLGEGYQEHLPLQGGLFQWWLLVSSVAKAASNLCRAGCWGPCQWTLIAPLLWRLWGICRCHMGCCNSQWQSLPRCSAEKATGNRVSTHHVAGTDIHAILLLFKLPAVAESNGQTVVIDQKSDTRESSRINKLHMWGTLVVGLKTSH